MYLNFIDKHSSLLPKICQIFIVLTCGIPWIATLSMVRFEVPSHAITNESALLECIFELDGEGLYSVKWYKDSNEFYRYVPKYHTPVQVFPTKGINVYNSSQGSVLLYPIVLQTNGHYRCEVSAEAPSFQTVTDHGHMTVVALPESGPIITGGRARYLLNDFVQVNCTSKKSKPAAHLSWFINGEPADRTYLRGPERIVSGREGLETTILGLQFRVKKRHFRANGDLKLKCVASIEKIYYKSNEESIEGRRTHRKQAVLDLNDIQQSSASSRVNTELVLSINNGSTSSTSLNQNAIILMLVVISWTMSSRR